MRIERLFERIPPAELYAIGPIDCVDRDECEQVGSSKSTVFPSHTDGAFVCRLPERWTTKPGRYSAVYDVVSCFGYSNDCSLSPLHVTRRWVQSVERVTVNGGASDSSFLVDPLRQGPSILMQESAHGIATLGLRGFASSAAPYDADNSSGTCPGPLSVLCGRVPAPMTTRTLSIAFENTCPFCGTGPIVCPVCHHIQWSCEKCDEQVFRNALAQPSRPDVRENQRRDFADVFPETSVPNRVGSVIEWESLSNEHDVFDGDVFRSEHVCEVLMQIHGPVRVYPMQLHFGGGLVGYTYSTAEQV
ncbi:hypothetical protein Pla175_35940 [Pirellulimonas nuda]|uniref:Uncharacterized protein n=1 Tax=Pirellulimonas nuda TaxID=2528009 RepID=A0A518DFH9_9BACT|nr:hypothetical protein Pla175_35940 [Pirellulimonas nuda]